MSMISTIGLGIALVALLAACAWIILSAFED